MALKRISLVAVIGAAIIWLAGSVAAQTPEPYKARLSWAPISAVERASVAGMGSVSAVLAGRKLSVTGSFEGLQTPATVGHVHRGPGKGVRGPAVFDLTVTKGISGSITGSFDLTPEQVEGLRAGRFYIQIDSEKTSEGNLWGWLSR